MDSDIRSIEEVYVEEIEHIIMDKHLITITKNKGVYPPAKMYELKIWTDEIPKIHFHDNHIHISGNGCCLISRGRKNIAKTLRKLRGLRKYSRAIFSDKTIILLPYSTT